MKKSLIYKIIGLSLFVPMLLGGVFLMKANALSVGGSGTINTLPIKTFLGLTDTPNSFVGQGGKVVSVKSDVSGLEFTNSSGSPAGNDTEVQFNDGGAFAGNSGLKYNKTDRVLKVDKGLIIGESNFGLTPPTSGILMNGPIHSGVWMSGIESNAPYRFFDTTTDMTSPVLHISNDYGQQYGSDLRLYNYASAEYMITDGNLGALEFSANKELVDTLTEEVVGAKITSDSEVDWTYGPEDAQYRANLKFYTSNAGTLTERGRFHGTGDFEVLGTGKVISPTILSPIILGGTSATQDLTLQTTSGVGATGADMHFLVGNNGATEAMTILNSGNVGIGQTSPNAKLHVVSADGRVVNFTSTVTDLSGSIIGALNTLNVTPSGASTATFYANYNQLIADGTLSNSNSVIGVYSKVIHQTTGTLGIVNSGLFEISNTTSGTITSAVGVRIGIPYNPSGTLVNTTGLHISSQTAGTQSTTPYGIYQAGTSDRNYFAGNVGIGDTTPSVRLEVGVVADGSVVTLNGGASGVNLLTLNRNSGGVVQSYGLALASGKLVFQDVTNTQYIFYSAYANFGGLGNLPTLNIGPYEPNNTSVGTAGLLKSRGAGTTGTDTAGGNLYIASGAGRGNGTQSQINFYTPNKVGSGTSEQTYGTAKMVILGDGSVGIGVTSPTGVLHLKAGTATASTAPLKFTSGTLNTTAEAGAFEYDGSNLTFTRTGTTREIINTTVTKTTTGDGTGVEGLFQINTFDNTFKVYAEGAWRQLATW